jgi:hypothetical protein
VWRLHYGEKCRPEEGEARVLETESPEEGNNEILGDINEREVKEALKKMKNEKAAGWDEIAPDTLKAGGEALEKRLTKLFTKVWREDRVPKDWEKNIIPLYKKGESSKCEHYRAVVFIFSCSKSFFKDNRSKVENGHRKGKKEIKQLLDKHKIPLTQSVLYATNL